MIYVALGVLCLGVGLAVGFVIGVWFGWMDD